MWPSLLSGCASIALTLVSPVFAATKEIWWDVTYVDDISPDGLYPRRVVGVNGTWPPPPLDVDSDEDLLVHVTNSLDVPTSLHHHGMFFNSTAWMDGAVGLSQCGIPVGSTFDYVVPVSTSGQRGTYWVHAHASGQYVDGLRAPFVIHPESEVYSYDEEYTIVLGDWYHEQHSDLLREFISVDNPEGNEPVPDSALMYFAQNATYLPPIPGTSSAVTSSAVGFNENATLPFEPGKTYRLRVVNTAAFAGFYFWIDGHEMRVIEADGIDTEEYVAEMLSLTVAQRYSVLVTARDDTESNWAIHANMDVDMFDDIPDSLNPNATSTITYNSSAPSPSIGFVSSFQMINDTALVPLEVIPMYPPADLTIPLVVLLETMDDGTNRGMFNDVTYNPPLVPGILSALTLGENATVAGAYGPSSLVWGYLDVVDIVLMNDDDGKHPFHLHGHTMQIVHRAENYTSDDPELNPPFIEGQANPMRRDTVHVPGGGSVTLRVVADNPGVWFIHCHIEWHLESGLALTIIEAPLIAQSRGGMMPPFIAEQCAKLGYPTSGNAAGKHSTTDLEGLPVGPYRPKDGDEEEVRGWVGLVWGVGRWDRGWVMFGGGLAALLGLAVIVKSFRNKSRTRISAEDEVRNEQTNNLVKIVEDGFSAYSREEAKALLSA